MRKKVEEEDEICLTLLARRSIMIPCPLGWKKKYITGGGIDTHRAEGALPWREVEP